LLNINYGQTTNLNLVESSLNRELHLGDRLE